MIKINELPVTYTEVKPKSQSKMNNQKKPVHVWIDENDLPIPYSRITKSERLQHRSSKKILKNAMDLNNKLKQFKSLVTDISNEVFEAVMLEKNSSKVTKGNFCWYNFDRSIKIEVNVNESLEFDDLTIQAAKSKLDEFLSQNITASNIFIKELIMGAFSTQRKNQLDTKRVLGLAKYDTKINKPLFSEAISLINEAVRKTSSKTYFRIYQKDGLGEYKNIDLNLSSIKI